MYNESNYENINENFYSYERPKKKKGKTAVKILSAVLCGVLFGTTSAGTFFGVNSALNKISNTFENKIFATDSKKSSNITKVSYKDDGETKSLNLDVSDIADGMMPAMVSITNISVQEIRDYFGMFGRGGSFVQQLESSGTGIIIGENDDELLIVTNNHVVEGAETLSVCFVDEEVCEAIVKGTDSDNDLAVIAVKLSDIKEETFESIKIAEIGDSDELKVGEQVVAIGNALGYGQSVTTGIVSALNRQIEDTDATMIQTDAAINPGNSGGALLNMAGEVIGINSVKFSSTDVEGMGYAISISTVMPIIENLMNRTTREKVAEENRAYLGISGEDISSEISSAYGMPIGIFVTYVNENSPAKEAGISAKSIITHFDGIRVSSLSDLQEKMEYYAAGETVEITIQVLQDNEYTEKTVEITLGTYEYSNNNPFQDGMRINPYEMPNR